MDNDRDRAARVDELGLHRPRLRLFPPIKCRQEDDALRRCDTLAVRE
jgi:hypothetical protein